MLNRAFFSTVFFLNSKLKIYLNLRLLVKFTEWKNMCDVPLYAWFVFCKIVSQPGCQTNAESSCDWWIFRHPGQQVNFSLIVSPLTVHFPMGWSCGRVRVCFTEPVRVCEWWRQRIARRWKDFWRWWSLSVFDDWPLQSHPAPFCLSNVAFPRMHQDNEWEMFDNSHIILLIPTPWDKKNILPCFYSWEDIGRVILVHFLWTACFKHSDVRKLLAVCERGREGRQAHDQTQGKRSCCRCN